MHYPSASIKEVMRPNLHEQFFQYKYQEACSGDYSVMYYGVTLTTQVGQFPAGSRFPGAELNPYKKLLILIADNKSYYFELQVAVAQEIADPDKEFWDSVAEQFRNREIAKSLDAKVT